MTGAKSILNIVVSGDLTTERFYKVAQMAEKKNPGEIKIHIRRSLLYESVTAVDLAGVVSGLAGLCSFLLLIKKEINAWQEARTWSASKLTHKVEDEMFRLGVTDFRIVKLKGFDALLSKTGDFCCVEAIDATDNCLYRVYVSVDGDTYSIKVERCSCR